METRKLKLAVAGLTGAGKSTILNAIVGREVFQEGHELEHKTLKVTPHTWSDPDNNYEVTVYDTPGFEDDSGDTEKYKADIENNCSDVDLLLYCISVEESYFMSRGDRKTLKELKHVFGPSVWNHCVVVLTFANTIVLRNETKYRSKLNAKNKVKTEYEAAIGRWKEEVNGVLIECLGEELSQNIAVVPAGSASCFSILNDKTYWLSELYHIVIELAEVEQTDVLIMLNGHRYRSGSSVNKEEFIDVKITEQPLVVSDGSTKVRKRLKELAVALGVGGVSGATGAGVGAIVGTFAIGVPTFGIAAGIGTALGALIGGAIGVGVGVGVHKIIDKYKEQKHDLDPTVKMLVMDGFI